MVVRGHVRNGVVVLPADVHLKEGEEVTIVTQTTAEHPVSEERRTAALSLIGIWKTDNPPSDEDVERIIEEYRMEKYG